MKGKFTLALAFAFGALMPAAFAADEPDYSEGVYILNEDWFGHQNSTINYLSPEGEWEYRVFQKVNPGMEIGGTSQYGVIFNDTLYIISKQAQDPAASVMGGRITVCDARTMKCIKQIANIAEDDSGNSIADGRAFVGVNPHKGYVSTSNGIYPFDLDRLEVGGIIEGTGGDGGLYAVQCGTMVAVGDTVFAVHQKAGLMVIDAAQDTLITTLAAPLDGTSQRGYGSVVRSLDGALWLSVAADVSGSGSSVDYLVRVDARTLDTVRVALPEGYGVPNSWYAWTADGFCASQRENRLYWKNNGGWFASTKIYYYDIDTEEFGELFDTQSIGWNIYGAGFRVHPVTDELYCSLYQEFMSQSYQTVRISNRGELLDSYEMIDNCWFPAMPVFFPAEEAGEGGGTTGVELAVDGAGLGVWPNPVEGVMYIRVDTDCVAEVYSLTGALLTALHLTSGENAVDAASWKPGIYIVCAGGEAVKVIKK